MTNVKTELTNEIKQLRLKLAEADNEGKEPITSNEELLCISRLLDKKINEFYKLDKK